MDDGGYVEGCGFRIWTEFPLAEIADILSRKEVTTVGTEGIIYLCMLKPSWSTWLSTHVQYCGCAHKVKSSIINAALCIHYIITTTVTNWTLCTRKFLLNSYWTPSTGFLLDSYWTPTGLLVLDSSIPIP